MSYPQRVGEWCRGDDPSEADDGRNRAQHADDLVDRRTGRESGVNALPVRRQGCVDGDEHAEPNECWSVDRARIPTLVPSDRASAHADAVILTDDTPDAMWCRTGRKGLS